MAINLRSNDTIQVRIPQGGGSVRDVPLSELNEYISSEEAADITALETAVGTYAGDNNISTDLATVYAQYHKNKYDATAAPGATDDSTDGYSVGSKWFDATHTEWYICTSAVENAATWAQTTVDSADLGTAAVADIVNDLTTGGIADALSAEQGKELKSTLNTEAGYIDALQAVAPEYVATFATAAAAQGTLTLTGNVTAGDEVTIGSVTYKFVAEPAAAYDVAIAGSASDTIDNLIAAITAGEGVGTAYGAGTVAHPDVTAAVGQDDTMTVTAKIKGVAGNAIGTTDPTDAGDVIAFGAAALAGGVDGQVGATGKIIFTDDVVYFCTDGAKCTIADSSGWKTVTMSQ